jgi:hypothetical protein
MATLSTVAVDFVANTAKYTSGLENMSKQTKAWSGGIKKDTQGATDAFDGVSKSLDRLAKQVVSIVAIQKIGTAFAQAAKDVSMLADEAEKVGASAEQFSKLSLAAERNGANIQDVKIAYKELQKSFNEGLRGNKDTINSFNQLGISLNYLAGLNPDQRFISIANALSKVADENQRAEIGTRLLGKAYTELAPLIAKGAAGIQIGGRGALSATEIEKVDKVTKSFEELSRTIDTELKKALVSISQQLISIAKAATFVVENFGSIATVATFAFSPFILSKFAEGLTSISTLLLKFIINVRNAQAATEFLGGINPMEKFLASLGPAATFSEKLRLGIAGLSAGLLALAAVAGKVVASLTALYLITIGIIKAFQIANEIGANLLEIGDKNSETAAEYRKKAKEYEDSFNTLNSIIKQFVSSSNEQTNVVEATTKAERDAATASRERARALALQAAAIDELRKKGDELLKQLTSFGESATKELVTPYEKASEEFNKLIDALDIGTISFETFSRAVEKLKKSLDAFNLEKLRAIYGTGPQGVLGNTPQATISEQTRFSQRGIASENFGGSTIVGGKLPKELENIKSAYDDFQQQLKNTGIQLLENGRTAEEVYKKEVEAINAAVEAYKEQGREEEGLRLQTIALVESSNKLRDANIEAFAKANPEILKAFDLMSNFADQFSRAIVEGQNFGEALRNIFRDILKQIAVLTLRTIILQGIMAAIGLASPVAAASFGKMTGLVPRAAGGPVMAGGGYRVGEAGPETFIPSTNGYIIPNDMAPSETIVVNQTINVQTGVSQTVRAEMASLLPKFKQEAMAGVLDAKQRGGAYSKGLAGA